MQPNRLHTLSHQFCCISSISSSNLSLWYYTSFLSSNAKSSHSLHFYRGYSTPKASFYFSGIRWQSNLGLSHSIAYIGHLMAHSKYTAWPLLLSIHPIWPFQEVKLEFIGCSTTWRSWHLYRITDRHLFHSLHLCWLRTYGFMIFWLLLHYCRQIYTNLLRLKCKRSNALHMSLLNEPKLHKEHKLKEGTPYLGQKILLHAHSLYQFFRNSDGLSSQKILLFQQLSSH